MGHSNRGDGEPSSLNWPNLPDSSPEGSADSLWSSHGNVPSWSEPSSHGRSSHERQAAGVRPVEDVPAAGWNLRAIALGRKLRQPYPEFGLYEHVRRAGAGVRVYIFDGGVQLTHKAFSSNRASNFEGVCTFKIVILLSF